MDKVRKYAEMSKNGEAAAKSDPALMAEMKKVGDFDGYNVQKADMMEKSPHIAAFLKSNGMTARDFVFIPMTALTAVTGCRRRRREKTAAGVCQPGQHRFVREHKNELEKLNLVGRRRRVTSRAQENPWLILSNSKSSLLQSRS